MIPDSPDSAAEIRGAGLRVTRSRCEVLDALRGGGHASADHVFARVASRMPGASLQSVYNALADFEEAGLVRRIIPAGQPMLFERRVGDNHHHLVCTACGRIEDVDCVHGDAPCMAPAQTHGFAVNTAEVTFWGLCPDCARTDQTDDRPRGTLS